MKTDQELNTELVVYWLYGKRTQGGQWAKISRWRTLIDAQADEKDYRDFLATETHKGWLDFCIVRETNKLEVVQ